MRGRWCLSRDSGQERARDEREEAGKGETHAA
jgi:hypothetical protein